MGKISVKRILIFSAILLFIGTFFFVSRGPFISNQLKKLILPELSAATGRQVMVQKIYLNLFPLFIEAKGLRVSERGEEILSVPRIKGYLSVSGLLKRELVLRRLVIRGPSVKSDMDQAEDIARRVKEYMERERKSPLKVVVKAVALTEGTFTFRYSDMFFSGSGLGGDVVLGPAQSTSAGVSIPRINLSIKNLSANIKGWPELKGEIKATAAVKDNALEVKGLQIGFYGSMVHASGSYGREGGTLQVRFGLLMESLRRIFVLKQPGEGGVSAKGTIHFIAKEPLRSVLNLELDGNFYLQTLMELLKVKEKVEGFVTFSGDLKGPLERPAGNAKARLRRGNLFGIDLDELTCSVVYKDGILNFTGGKAALYNGHADAEAVLAVAGEEFYSLRVSGSGIDSPAVFKLIGWDPGVPLGKVKGVLSTEGRRFNPSGWFEYESLAEGKDVLGRIKKMKGSFRLLDDILTFSNSEVSTPQSTFTVNGDVDIAASSLSLKAEMRTSDIRDITLPYLHELTGSVSGSGMITGKFDDLLISVRARLNGAAYDGYPLGDVTGDLNYKKNRLEVKGVTATDASLPPRQAAITAKGEIRFPEAKELFDFGGPVYALDVSLKNGDLERLTRLLYRKPLNTYPGGNVNADFTITGKAPEPVYKGSLKVAGVKIGDISIDSASSLFSYDYTTLLLKETLVRKGDSTLTAGGGISRDGRFNFKATGSRVFLKDTVPGALPFDARLSFRAEGSGTFEDPEIDMEGTLQGGRVKNIDVGDGRLKASLRGRTFMVNASFFNEKLTVSGKADLTGNMPWTARLDARSGRYDSLITSFLKDTPEDLLVNMKGHVDMAGDRNHFSAKAVLNQLNITLYGYNFASDTEMRIEMRDRRIVFPGLKMRSGTASFTVQGSMELNRGYDLVIEGSSALSPLKGFSRRIDAIKGDAAFVLSVTGKWASPEIKGGVTISNALFGLKDFPHRFSAINGYLYMDEDKIVIERLSGKMGGGDVGISGVAYIQALKMRRFYIDVVTKNIGMNVSKDFSVSFGGNLLYKGTADSQTLSGEISISRASYRERVEWKSWLLKARARERPRGELGALEKAALHVRVHGVDNILIDNNIARATLKVDMLLRGTIAHPVFFGRLESKTGSVYFRNNEFKIVSASADFSDPRRINPVLAIVAETSVKGYNIRMNLEGQLERFNLSLISEPHLEEIDILALLTVGRFGKELKGIESGIGAGEATSFLTGKFQDVVEERLRSITGFERLEVDPYVSKTTGTVTPRVTVSKRLLGERLFVTYSSAVGSAENNVLKLEYLLEKNISLVGVRDEQGGLGGDIKFRFEFK